MFNPGWVFSRGIDRWRLAYEVRTTARLGVSMRKRRWGMGWAREEKAWRDWPSGYLHFLYGNQDFPYHGRKKRKRFLDHFPFPCILFAKPNSPFLQNFATSELDMKKDIKIITWLKISITQEGSTFVYFSLWLMCMQNYINISFYIQFAHCRFWIEV